MSPRTVLSGSFFGCIALVQVPNGDPVAMESLDILNVLPLALLP